MMMDGFRIVYLEHFFEADAAIQAEYQFDETDHQEWIDFIVEAPKKPKSERCFYESSSRS